MLNNTQDTCQVFQTAVCKFIHRQRKKIGEDGKKSSEFSLLEGHALYLSCHATHVLEKLNAKTKSLHSAIQAWDECSNQCATIIQQQLASGSITTAIFTRVLQETLQHWFTHYLRLRDGFILLTSGECRHPMDSLESRKAKTNGYSLQKMTQLMVAETDDPNTINHRRILRSIQTNFSFPSQLDVEPASSRKDGYTKLFKSKNGYSGYGWDEFYNDDVGIRRRLLLVLFQMTIFPRSLRLDESYHTKINQTLNKIWDDGLLEKGGAHAFEQAFDQHETDIQSLKRVFEERCDSFIAKVNQILASYPQLLDSKSVQSASSTKEQYATISTYSQQQQGSTTSKKRTPSGHLVITKVDKFERLELKEARTLGITEFMIQRQGDAFKVTDKHGVLPCCWNTLEWTEIMKLPQSLHSSLNKKGQPLKKFRRIIEDDEGDGDDNNNNINNNEDDNKKKPHPVMNPIESNLKVVVVVVEDPCTGKHENQIEESLEEIKKQFGVDSIGLEQSREALEAEENQSRTHIQRPDSRIQQKTHYDSHRHLQDIIMNEREQLELFKRALRKASDLDESWDAHESLRQSFMFLGSQLLSLHDFTPENTYILSEAETCFQSTLKILTTLLNMTDRCFKEYTKAHLDFIKRTLLLCRGRALTNLGRTFLEQSTARSQVNPISKSKRLRMAIECLNESVSCAKALRAQCLPYSFFDDDKYVSYSRIHKYEADELEAMGFRWLGLCLWQKGAKEEALATIAKSTLSISSLPRDSSQDGKVLEAYMKVLVEQYYGSSSLINLSTMEIDEAPSLQVNAEYYGRLFSIAQNEYNRAVEISDILYSLARSKADSLITVHDLHHEHDVANSQELNVMRNRFMIMREEKVKNASSGKSISLPPERGNDANVFGRNDIFHSGFMPTSRYSNKKGRKFIVDDKEACKLPSHSSKGAIANNQSDDYFDNFGLDMSENHKQVRKSEPLTKVACMLWGDDVLRAMGKQLNQYPSCCPEKREVFKN